MSSHEMTRVSLITGASQGIGRAIAVRLGGLGYAVAVNYSQDAAAAADTVRAITDAGGTARALPADAADIDAVAALFADVEAAFGRLNVFVANAGRSVIRPIAEITPADFERVISLNVRGTLFALQQAARRVVDGGRIIVISSSITRIGGAGTGLYAASKAAGEQFVQALSRELGPRGITVNAIAPGYTDAGGMNRVPAEYRTRGKQLSPFGRLGEPDEIAAAVAWLVSDDARWVTGQVIHVNGGIA